MTVRQKILDHARPQRLRDGTRVFLRPLRAQDLDHANEFFARLSDRTKYYRFMTPTPRLTSETLAMLVAAMHAERSGVVVAVVEHTGGEELIGGMRVVPTARATICEFALTIPDDWQSRGVGTVLLKEAMRVARELGYHRIEGNVLTINGKMLKVARRLRFTLRSDPEDASVTIVSRQLLP